MASPRRAMAFGVFDGLHEGHRYFLSQALARCGHLTVVLTLPEVVQTLKSRLPRQDYDARAAALTAFNRQLEIIPSDDRIGSWKVLLDHAPDIIFLGYDQQPIAAELDKLKVAYEYLEARRPDTYKSSLLNGDSRSRKNSRKPKR